MPFDPFGSSDLPGPRFENKERDECGEAPDRPWYDLGGHWNDAMSSLRSMVGLENDIVDASDAYAANHDYRIYFEHIATGKRTVFKAFLTDFDDQYSSEWNDVDVYGRMDPIVTFQGTRRQINFSFDVVAGSAAQAKRNYEQSYNLIRSLYPVYSKTHHGADASRGFSATSLRAPPLLKIRFKNLIRAGLFESVGAGPKACANIPLVGKLSGLSYRPTMDVGFYETAGAIYPKVNSFSCNFTVLHTGPVGFGLQQELTTMEQESSPEEAETQDSQDNTFEEDTGNGGTPEEPSTPAEDQNNEDAANDAGNDIIPEDPHTHPRERG